MVKVKTGELTGAALDWAVAKAQGRTPTLNMNSHGRVWHGWWLATGGEYERMPNYSNDWACAGPILEREITKVFRNVGGTWSAMILKDVPIPPEDRGTSLALTRRAQWNGAGPTALIAAMRCFCCSKLGSEIEVPDELL